jgi:hypothetical protein
VERCCRVLVLRRGRVTGAVRGRGDERDSHAPSLVLFQSLILILSLSFLTASFSSSVYLSFLLTTLRFTSSSESESESA